ncbi:MAG TPA: hypothetical protein DCO77_07595 [Nitrospiraceae bacterium]|nr:hypothetical protein [Nitrospiraceae bacterium]
MHLSCTLVRNKRHNKSGHLLQGGYIRFANRPPLEKIFKESILKEKHNRDKTITTAIEKYGYTQHSIADHFGLHFTYVIRILYGLYMK